VIWRQNSFSRSATSISATLGATGNIKSDRYRLSVRLSCGLLSLNVLADRFSARGFDQRHRYTGLTAMYVNCSVPAADPLAHVTVNPTPAFTAEIYGDFTPPINVAAAAFLGVNEMTEFACTRVSATAVDVAALSVNVPLMRGNSAFRIW
jgi:hypothetical protein